VLTGGGHGGTGVYWQALAAEVDGSARAFNERGEPGREQVAEPVGVTNQLRVGHEHEPGTAKSHSCHFTSLYLPSSSKYKCSVYSMQLTTVWEGAARHDVTNNCPVQRKRKKTSENKIK